MFMIKITQPRVLDSDLNKCEGFNVILYVLFHRGWSYKEEEEPVFRIRIRIEFSCLDPDQDPGGQP
jgi:hypothetical protein